MDPTREPISSIRYNSTRERSTMPNNFDNNTEDVFVNI